MENSEVCKRYGEKLKKINLLYLVVQACAILLAIGACFFPIYKTVYETKLTLDLFGGDLEAYLNYLSTLSPEEALTGIVHREENFSMFNELLKAINGFKVKEEGASMVSVFFLICPILVVFSSLRIFCSSAIALYRCVRNVKDNEQYILLEYKQIKNSGATTDEMTQFCKITSITDVVMWSVLAVLCGGYVMEHVFQGAPNILSNYSNLSAFAGISGWVVLVFILVIVYAAGKFILGKQSRAITFEILKDSEKEDIQKKQQETIG